MKPLQYQLENGLKVILLPAHAAPVVACNVWVGVGSADETAHEAGLAHVHEHMLFKGTSRREVGEIAASVESCGGMINAFTSFDFTCYYVVQSSRDFENALDVLSDAIQFSSFDETELSRELEVIQEELKRGKDSPERVVGEMLFANAYMEHPYRNPIIGTEESIAAFTRDDVLNFYQTHYVPSNCTVVIVGDFEIDAAKLLIKRYFGNWHGPVHQRMARPYEPEQTKLRAVVDRHENSSNFIEVGFQIPEIHHEDIAPLRLLATYLGVGESSRLYHKLHRELELVSGLYASCYTPRDQGLFNVSAQYQIEDEGKQKQKVAADTDGDLFGESEDVGTPLSLSDISEAMDMEGSGGGRSKHEKVIYHLFRELFEVRFCKISERELNRARTILESSEIYRKQTVQGLAMRLGHNAQVTGNPNYDDIFLQSLRKVTVEDLQRVAQRYLKPSNCTVVFLRSDSTPELSERELARIVHEASTNQEVAARQSSEQVFFSLHGEAGDVIKCNLVDNIQLVVQEDHSVELYSIVGINFGGTRYETEETCGISTLAQDLITSGTHTRSALEIAEFMESKASFLGGSVGRNTFALEAVGLSRFFDDGLECFADCWLNYTVPEDEFRLKQTEVLRLIKMEKDELAESTIDAMRKAFFQPHPYALPLQGLEQSVRNLTSGRLRQEMSKLTRCDSMILCVVGDVNADQVAERAAELFRRISLPYQEPSIAMPQVRTAPVLVRNHLNKQQSYISVGFAAPTVSDPLRYAGMVLRAILNGQGGRLFLELRDRQSLAYSVGAMGGGGIETSCMMINIGTSPEKVENALRGIYNEVYKLHEGGVTEQELARAKRYLAGNHDIGLQRCGARAKSFAINELFGLGYGETLHFADKIESVTTQQVEEYIALYLNSARSVASITTPDSVEVPEDLLERTLAAVGL